LPQAEAGLRITAVSTIDRESQTLVPLVNDSDVVVTSLAAGIAVQCDAEVEPATITRTTCTLTVEIPLLVRASPEGPPLVGYQPLILHGIVQASGRSILWRPTVETSAALPGLPAVKLANDRGILARLTLRGNFIWARNDPGLFLDGEAFALPQAGTVTTALQLPSGDRRRGGTFEMWFWIIATPVVLAGLSLDPPEIFLGDTATGTLTLSDVAPPGGFLVVITASNPDVGQVSTRVFIPAGASTATFRVAGIGVGTTTVTATAKDVALSSPLTVVERPIVLAELRLDPSTIVPGDASTGILTLSRAAPATGVTVALTSSAPDVARGLPASLTIQGSATGTFTVTGQSLGSTVIQGVLGATRGAILQVVRPKDVEKENKDEAKELKPEAKEIKPEGKPEAKELKPEGKENLAEEQPQVVPGRKDNFASDIGEPIIRGVPATPRPRRRTGGKPRRGSRGRPARSSTNPEPSGQLDGVVRAPARRRAFIRPDERPRIGDPSRGGR
jgi:hypothetical protein